MELKQLATYEMQTKGVDEASAQFDRLEASQKRAGSSADVLTKQVEIQEKSITRVSSKLNALANKELTDVEKALKKVQYAEALEAAAKKDNIALTDHQVQGIERVKARYEELSRAANDNRHALGEHSSAMGLNRMQVMESVHVLKAFTDEVVAGQNPIRALAIEGGRIGQIFASGDSGVGGTLKAFGGIVTGFVLNPLTLMVGGLGVAGAAMLQFIHQQEELERALNGVGRGAGVSADGLRALGVSGAARGGISSGQGIALAGQLAGTGRISGDLMPGIIGTTQRYSRAFGLDLADAGKELAQAFADPTKGAEELDKRLGFLDDRTKTLIRDFQEQGDIIGAQKTLFDAYNASLGKTTDTTWGLTKAWEALKGVMSDAGQGIGSKFAPSLQQQLDALEARRAGLSSGSFFSAKTGLAPDTAALDREIADLRRQVAAERENAARAKADLDAKDRADKASDIVRSVLPEIGERQGLVNRRGNLASALGDPETLRKMGVSADQATHALANLDYQFAHWQTSVQKAAEDSALATKQTEAWTFAERAAVASEQARLAVLRQSGDVALAAAEAEKARNALIAEGNKKASDLLKGATDEEALRGLSPYAAARARVQQQTRDFREQYIPEKGDLAPYVAPLRSGFTAAGSAATHLADVLNGAAARIGGASSGSTLPFFAGGSAPSVADPRGMSGYIRERASAYGIDPDIALRVARSEGLRDFNGDYTNGRPTSFGALQLHIGGGIGDEFRRDTGLDPSNPANEQATIDYALKVAAQRGWGPWHGAAKVGIGNFEGIGGSGGANDNGVPALKSTAGADISGYEQKKLAGVDYDYTSAKIKQLDQDLAAQNATLDKSIATWGMTEGAIARAAKEQELINQFTAAAPEKLDAMMPEIQRIAQGYGDLAQRAAEAKKSHDELVSTMDNVRSTSREALGTFVSDLRQGKSGAEALRDALAKVEDRLLSIAEDSIISGLFGKQGTPGGGLLGGLLGSLFSFADGGVMTSHGPLPLRRYADGGIASSPQLAMFGEGSGPEAYVPLRNGGIPVHLKMPAMQAPAAQMPRFVFENHAANTDVQPVYATHSEVRYMIVSTLAENNKQQSEADRRAA